MNQLSTKEKILAKSRVMFNLQGVENITTRHIAKELGISQGNLHYHYPNKDELLKKLFSNLKEDFKAAEQFVDNKALSPEKMLLSMTENFKIMNSYRLFFQQNDVIWRRIPIIKDEMTQLYQVKQSEILVLINLFREEGKFRKEITENQIHFLAAQIIFNIQSWLIIKNYQSENHSPEYYAKSLFRLWLPYLNESEMKKWEVLLT